MSVRDSYLDYTDRFFRKWLPVYDLFARTIYFVYRAGARTVDAAPGRSILDICTGTGEMALRLARRGANVTGIDITEAMLERARRKTRGTSIRLQRMDARKLEFADGSFDGALLSFALHDMPRKVRKQVLFEALRVARDELVIVDYDFPRRRLFRVPLVRLVRTFETAYFERFAEEGLLPLLHEAGMREVTVKKVGPIFAVWKVRLGRRG